MARPATDKRKRLIGAAIERFHEKGVAKTALADVATAAGIPKGDVYYYFKTKDELVGAVIEEWCRLMEYYLGLLSPLPSPRRRIEGFIDQAAKMSETYTTIGCPVSGLAMDLKREGGDLSKEAGRIYAVQFAWLKKQFVEAGFSAKKADEHARFLFAGYHGAILMAHALSESGTISSEIRSLKHWLAEVFSPKTG